MNFDEFREQLRDDLKERLAEKTGQTFDISLSDVAKLQNAGYSGIVVRKEGNPLGLNLDASAIFKCIGKTDIDKTYSMPKSRISYRKPRRIARDEVALFDEDVFREAIINAFVHNKWVDGNAPMITIFSDRMEILSRGTLAPKQTMKGFYLGESVPVNQELSDVFLQLHISERSGRGVPKITKKYGKEAYEFRENSIVVKIPFFRISLNVGDKVRDNVGDKEKKLNPTRTRILEEMRNNPNVTHEQLEKLVGVGRTAIQNNISYLRNNGFIERIGSNKNGWWKVL